MNKTICVLLIIISQTSWAKNSLKLLSYNIHGLPAPLVMDQSRYKKIGKILNERRLTGSAPEIVLIQEAFASRTEELNAEAGYPYSAFGPNKESKLFSSGLIILSEYPIKENQVMMYGDDNCAQWDCYANKGAQIVTIFIPQWGTDISLLNTHNQAGKEYEEERIDQFEMLKKFVEPWVNNHPLILGGDFNTHPARASYPVLKNSLPIQDAGELCLNIHSCKLIAPTTPDEVWLKTKDHFFTKNLPAPASIEKTFRAESEDEQLSDHLGYEMTLDQPFKD